jgi:hypothetical protein
LLDVFTELFAILSGHSCRAAIKTTFIKNNRIYVYTFTRDKRSNRINRSQDEERFQKASDALERNEDFLDTCEGFNPEPNPRGETRVSPGPLDGIDSQYDGGTRSFRIAGGGSSQMVSSPQHTADAKTERAVDVAPLTLHIGAEISGVDLTKPLPPDQLKQVRDAFLKVEGGFLSGATSRSRAARGHGAPVW